MYTGVLPLIDSCMVLFAWFVHNFEFQVHESGHCLPLEIRMHVLLIQVGQRLMVYQNDELL